MHQVSTNAAIVNPLFNKRRPKFLQLGSRLAPELQNIFTLGYFHGAKEISTYRMESSGRG